MTTVELTDVEWMIIRDAVSAFEGTSRVRDELVDALHKKLRDAANAHGKLCLLINKKH